MCATPPQSRSVKLRAPFVRCRREHHRHKEASGRRLRRGFIGHAKGFGIREPFGVFIASTDEAVHRGKISRRFAYVPGAQVVNDVDVEGNIVVVVSPAPHRRPGSRQRRAHDFLAERIDQRAAESAGLAFGP
jgi:hypothetical protein